MSMIKFDPVSARRLVTLLGSDDGFRGRFLADPILALELEGLMPDGDEGDVIRANARCFFVTQLAPKAAILAARQELDRMLTSGSSQTVPALDAGNALGLRLKSAA